MCKVLDLNFKYQKFYAQSIEQLIELIVQFVVMPLQFALLYYDYPKFAPEQLYSMLPVALLIVADV
jgi:hypothetical protein